MITPQVQDALKSLRAQRTKIDECIAVLEKLEGDDEPAAETKNGGG